MDVQLESTSSIYRVLKRGYQDPVPSRGAGWTLADCTVCAILEDGYKLNIGPRPDVRKRSQCHNGDSEDAREKDRSSRSNGGEKGFQVHARARHNEGENGSTRRRNGSNSQNAWSGTV